MTAESKGQESVYARKDPPDIARLYGLSFRDNTVHIDLMRKESQKTEKVRHTSSGVKLLH